jgi:hypothetical protein
MKRLNAWIVAIVFVVPLIFASGLWGAQPAKKVRLAYSAFA